MGPLEKEIMGNILESVLSELDAFLALSAVSHAWRSAAGAPRLWQHWRFQDAGFDLATWLADDKADIMTPGAGSIPSWAIRRAYCCHPSPQNQRDAALRQGTCKRGKGGLAFRY